MSENGTEKKINHCDTIKLNQTSATKTDTCAHISLFCTVTLWIKKAELEIQGPFSNDIIVMVELTHQHFKTNKFQSF